MELTVEKIRLWINRNQDNIQIALLEELLDFVDELDKEIDTKEREMAERCEKIAKNLLYLR